MSELYVIVDTRNFRWLPTSWEVCLGLVAAHRLRIARVEHYRPWLRPGPIAPDTRCQP